MPTSAFYYRDIRLMGTGRDVMTTAWKVGHGMNSNTIFTDTLERQYAKVDSRIATIEGFFERLSASKSETRSC